MGRKILNLSTIGAAVLGLSLVSGSAVACSISAWGTGSTASEDDAVDNKGSYRGICQLEVEVGASGGDYVEELDSFSAGESSVKSIFYINADAADLSSGASAVVYRLLDSGSQSLLDVVLSSDGLALVTSSGTSSAASLNSGWNSVVVEWMSGSAATMTVGQKPIGQPVDTSSTQTSGSVSGDVAGVQLGFVEASNGSPSGSASFDNYIANRTETPDRIIVSDADGDGSLGSADALAVFQLLFRNSGAEVPAGITVADSTPDCEEDGSLGSSDANCVFQRLFAQ